MGYINGIGMFFILLVGSSILTYLVSLLIQITFDIEIGVKWMAIINTTIIISGLFLFEEKNSNKIKNL